VLARGSDADGLRRDVEPRQAEATGEPAEEELGPPLGTARAIDDGKARPGFAKAPTSNPVGIEREHLHRRPLAVKRRRTTDALRNAAPAASCIVAMRRQKPFEEKTISKFWLMRLADLSSNLASEIFLSALSWYLMKYQSAPAYAAVLLAVFDGAKTVGGLALAPLGDRIGPAAMLRVGTFAILGGIVLPIATLLRGGGMSFAPMVAAIVLVATADAALTPVMSACILKLVPAGTISRAFSHKYTVDALGTLAAIAIGIVSIDRFGPLVSLVAAACLAAGACFTAFCLRLPESHEGPPPALRANYLADWIGGVRAVSRYRIEIWCMGMATLCNFVVAPLVALAAPFFVNHYSGAEGWRVVVLELAIATGMIFGAQFLHPALIRRDVAKVFHVRGGIAALAGVAATLCFSKNFCLWVADYFVLGTALIVTNISMAGMRAVARPAALRARMQAISYIVGQASTPVGFFVTGRILDGQALNSVLALYVLLLLAAFVVVLRMPKLKQLMALDEASLVGAYDRYF
jgi:hypothetical protein